MKQDDLEKTQLLRPVDDSERLYDTKPLPRIEEGAEAPTARQRSVRELPPQEILPPRQEMKKKTGFFTTGRKRALLLGAGFAAALAIGFMLAGYSQEQSAERQNQQKLEQQQMKDREQKLASQEAELKAQRETLERQKQELQARERELEDRSSRAKGRNEAIKEEASGSALGKLVDKVTGKEAQREAQVKENKDISAQADSDVAKLKQSIAEAQAMLDDVDAKLGTVAEMQQEAGRIKAKAESAYAENKDIIDKAVYYARTGADFLSKWLTQ